jgi:hypothetical protein
METPDLPDLPLNPFVPLGDGTDRYIIVTIDNEVVKNMFIPRFPDVDLQDREVAIFMSNPTFTLHNTSLAIGSTFPPVE